MANITPTIDTRSYPGGVVMATWPLILAADTCIAVQLPGYEVLSVQGLGTFDSASLAFQGSNDGTNFGPLTGKGGTTAIAITAAGVKAPNESCVFYRPSSTGGGGSSSTTVIGLFRPILP